MRRRTIWSVGLVGVVVVALAFAFSGPISRAVVAAIVDMASGYRVAFGSLDLRRDGATIGALRVERDGSPVLRATRLALRYRLRDLLPGSAHRFGLLGVELAGFHVTLVRHADGSFNISPNAVPLPQAPVNAGTAGGVPLRLAVTLRDGGLVLDDRFRALPESRRLELGGIGGTFAIDTAGRSTYHVRGRLAGDPGQPLAIDGRFDRDYALHRVRGRMLSIVPIANYFIDNPSARLESGTARSLDVEIYGFAPQPGVPLAYHLAGSADVVGAGMRIPGLLPSAHDMTGRLDFFDNGFATSLLTAQIGRLDVRIAGGLLNWNRLGFRLGIAASYATLAQVRGLFAFSRDLPLDGAAHLQTLLEGPVGDPLVATRVVAPTLTYDVFPVVGLGARAIYYKGALEVVGLRGRYAGLGVGTDGAVDFGTPVASRLLVDASGPTASVPYLAEVAPGARVRALGVLAGPDLRFDARGVVLGGGPGTTIGGLFHVDGRGDGPLGPIAVTRAGGSVVGTFYLDREGGRSGFWLDARDMPYADLARAARLPGIDLAAPEFGGRLDGSLAGTGPPSDFRIAGRIGGRALRVGGFALAAASGDVVGRIGNFRVGRVAARGPWGVFTGRGAYVGDGLALRGDYRGSFERLATLTGDLGGRGPVAGPIALLVDPRRTIVQTRGASTVGGRVLGVPVDGLAGTLSVLGKHVRIYAASGSVAGGTLVAAGTLDGPRSLGVSAAGLASSRLRAVVPLSGNGAVAAIGAYGLVGKDSRFEGGLALASGSSFDRFPVAGNGDVMLLGHGLRFSTTDAEFGPAVGTLDGRLGGIGTARPTYDTKVHLDAARLARFVRLAYPTDDDIAGTVVGDFRVSGRGSTLALAGRFALPEGSLNGLAFRDGTVDLRIDPRGGILARHGHVTVGSTQAGFGAFLRGGDAAFRLSAPRADLADFNDYFDAGDTLGGRGRIAARFIKVGRSIRTRADIAIAGLKYRRFDLGDAAARWNSTGSKVAGTIAFGGASGRLETAGTLELAARAPLDKLLLRSRFNGTARLRGLDLGVWLPALGYQVPLQGRVDADATIAGPLRNPDVRTDASLVGGAVGAFPIDRFSVSAASSLRRTTVTRAELDLPALALTGSGSFGLGDADPIAFGLHAKSPDVGSLATRLAKLAGVSGSAEVDVRVSGTRRKPLVGGGFDLEDAAVRGVRIPRALGQFTVSGRDVVLSSVEVGFATGTLLLAGSVPLQVSPFALGPPAAPIALELGAQGIALSDFAPLLPTGSALTGTLDGRVAVGGTAGAPRLDGALALADGSLVSPLETTPLSALGATLSFRGTEARLDALHAEAGGGSLDASGAATLADLVRPGPDATYRLSAVAKRLRLNFPAYGSGQIDGTLAVAHRAHRAPSLGGSLTLANATIPFTALLLAAPSDSAALGSTAAVPVRPQAANAVALDLTVTAADNVRVRSSNVDIGGRGAIHIGGTSADPALSGGFDSTGGTLTYINTVFRLLDGRVSFSPDLGLIPTLDARAITHVSNPDPNTLRNLAGTADVTLDVSGPVTNLAIGLTSEPAYDREQILGLLLSAPALGASTLFGNTAGVPTLYGSTSTFGAPRGFASARLANGQFSVAQEAFGIANAQFTRTLLAPIETSFAQAVGLSNVNVNVDYSGAVGVTARKVLGKNLNAIYGTSFGYPYRQTFGFEIKPNDSTAAQVTVFQTLGATGLTSLAPAAYSGNTLKLQAAQPNAGTVGFSLSLQRLFK